MKKVINLNQLCNKNQILEMILFLSNLYHKLRKKKKLKMNLLIFVNQRKQLQQLIVNKTILFKMMLRKKKLKSKHKKLNLQSMRKIKPRQRLLNKNNLRNNQQEVEVKEECLKLQLQILLNNYFYKEKRKSKKPHYKFKFYNKIQLLSNNKKMFPL